GQTTANIPVSVYGDLTAEADETFSLVLYSPTNATLSRSTATGTIRNDDPVINLSIGDASVTEGNSGSTTATFTVTLSQASASAVTFSYSTSNGTATSGSDYAYTSGSKTIAAGQTTTTIAVPVYGDTLNEANETFSLYVSGVSGATVTRSTG